VASARPGQITLKYIVLPGLNDNYADYSSVIEIMKVLQTKRLELSRDTRIKYTLDTKQSDELLEVSAYLVAMLHKNNMKFSMYTFSPIERKQIMMLAIELLQTGKV
jgi:hypothetical protein